MNTAKPVESTDTRLHQQEWPSDFNGSSMECASSLLAIEKTLKYCAEASLPKLIGIEGSVGSGKTILANALADNMDNALLIDLYLYSGMNKTKGTLKMTKRHTSYIFDEAEYFHPADLIKSVKLAVVKGCIVIMFFQTLKDVPNELLKYMQCFDLTLNNGLRAIKTL